MATIKQFLDNTVAFLGRLKPSFLGTKSASSTVAQKPSETAITMCLTNARKLLEASSKSLRRHPHISYHLSTLALEEIGKSELVGIAHAAQTLGDPVSWAEKHAKDHVKKLWWAIWGPSFGRELITGPQLESYTELALTIHNTRIAGLYAPTDPDGVPPYESISQAEAKTLLQLAEARLTLFKSPVDLDLSREVRELIVWFAEATEEKEKRALIFATSSMRKLLELADVREWMLWLREQFEDAAQEGQRQAVRELNRPRPSGEEAEVDKWRVRIRLYSTSHNVNARNLRAWNRLCQWIKLIPVEGRRDQLLIDITFKSSLSPLALWRTGYLTSRLFTASLNIATLGFFWFTAPSQTSRFYESLRDLVSRSDLSVERTPALLINWNGGVLSEQELRNTLVVFSMLSHIEAQRWEPFYRYLEGVALLSKTDIHLQFELDAFRQFYVAFKEGMRVFGDWDGDSSFASAYERQVRELSPLFDESAQYVTWGESLLGEPPYPEGITLSQVGMAKVLCDGYFLKVAMRYADDRRRTEETGPTASGSLPAAPS